MCELFGFSADHNTPVSPWLEDFYSHSPDHPHGWGLATFHNGVPSLEKEPVRAVDSVYLKHRLSSVIRCTDLMAHIRYATVGSLIYQNTHPFVMYDITGRCWTFEHNGTVIKSRELLDRYGDEQKGTTDSERMLLCVIHRINRKTRELRRPLTDLERFREIDDIVVRLSDGNKLNLIVYDGEFLYVHTNHRKNMHVFSGQGYKVFATKPLLNAPARAEGAKGGEWEPFRLCQLRVYKAGRLVFKGRDHGHLHKFTEKEIEILQASAAAAVGKEHTEERPEA